MVKNVAPKMGQKFATQMASAIFFGKLYHHIQIIGQTTRTIKNKIDDLILGMAKKILGSKTLGRTKKWILKEIGWLDYDQNTKVAIQKTTHNLLNIQNEYYITTLLTENRNVRNKAQNKVGPFLAHFGFSNEEQNSFLFQSIKNYNMLPKELTMIPNTKRFKKWIKKYYLEPSISIKKPKEHKYEFIPLEIDWSNIDMCLQP